MSSWQVLDFGSVIFNARYRTRFQRPLDLLFFLVINRLSVDKELGRTLRVHDILQRVREAFSTAVTIVCDVIFSGSICFMFVTVVWHCGNLRLRGR